MYLYQQKDGTTASLELNKAIFVSKFYHVDPDEYILEFLKYKMQQRDFSKNNTICNV